MTYTSNERSPLLRGSDELEGGSANPNGNVRYHSNTGSDWASRTRIDQVEGSIAKTITRKMSRIGPLEISRSERYAILAGVWTATFLSVRVPSLLPHCVSMMVMILPFVARLSHAVMPFL